MVVDQIRQIDTSKDNQINEQELIEAMKPNGFLSNEENLQAVGKLLNIGRTEKSDQELLSSLEQSFYSLESQILQKEDITDEDIHILNIYMKILGSKCEEEYSKIKNIIERHEMKQIMKKKDISLEDICKLEDYTIKLSQEGVEGVEKENLAETFDFIEWQNIKIMIEKCRNEGRITSDDKNKLIAFLNSLGLENCELQSTKQVKQIDEVIEFLQQESEIIINGKYKKLDQKSQKLLSDVIGGTENLMANIDNILSGNLELKTEAKIKGINILNKLLEEDTYRHDKLKQLVDESVTNMMHSVNEIIARNSNSEHPDKNYKEEEVMAIQLRANVYYDENLDINGQRDGVYGVGGDNKGLTNLYIYRLELKTRGEIMNFRKEMNKIEFGNLLNIPNLDAQLSLLPEESQNKILEKFLDFFLYIKKGGMHFENHIGSENLQIVLNNLINAERYKDTSVEDYYNTYKVYTVFYDGLTQDEIDQIETEFQEMKAKYQTMGEYFGELATGNMKKISEDNENFKEHNRQLALNNKIKKVYKLYAEIVGFQGDESKKNELKQQFEKIAKEILKNERLTEEQENNITDMILSIFPNIPGKLEYNTVDIYYSRGNNPYHIGEIYWNGSKSPQKIKHTQSCRVEVKYKEVSPTRAEMTVTLDGAVLDIEYKSLNELRNFTHNGRKYDIHYDAGDSDCLIISKLGEGSDLRSTFGDEFYQKSQSRQKELHDKMEKYKEPLSISVQVESTDPMQLKSLDWNCTNSTTDSGKKVLDFKSRINDETGYTEEYNQYMNLKYGIGSIPCYTTGTPSTAGIFAKEPDAPNYSEYHELNIPGYGGKLVHINPSELQKINKAIKKYQNNICFVPRDKKNQKIYELKLSDLKISKKDEKGNIHLYDINSDLNQGKEQQTISEETLKDANNTNGLIMTTIAATPGLEDAMNMAQDLSNSMAAIKADYEKFANQEMSESDLQKMYQKIIPLLKKINELNKYMDKLDTLYRGLLTRKAENTSTISRNDEIYIDSLMSNLDWLICNIGPTSQMGRDCKTLLNEHYVYANDSTRKRVVHRFKDNGITIISAIAGGVLAVCLMPATGGASMWVYLKMAMVMTAGGMISGAGGQVFNEFVQRQFTKKVGTIDGEPIYTTYDDPTSLEMAMNGDITRGEFALQTVTQFAIGTVTTFGCMSAGRLVGGRLSKAAGSLREGSIPKEICKRIIQLNKNFKVPDGDPVTQNMFEAMATNIGKNQQSLIAKFNQEFFQELREEAYETGFEELGNALKKTNPKVAMLCSGLSSLAMARHCLTPGGNIPNIYKEQGVTVGTRKNDMDYDNKEFTITLEYDGDRQALINYFTNKENQYQEKDGYLRKDSGIDGFKNVIKLRETHVPSDQRSLAGGLSGYGISIDTETGKGYYQNISKIQELELSGKANVKIDRKTKQVTIISGETSIILQQSPRNELLDIYEQYGINPDYFRGIQDIPLLGKDATCVHEVLSYLESNTQYDKDIEYFFTKDAMVVDYILNNSAFTIEDIKQITSNEKINIRDIEHAIKENANITNQEQLIQEIKKSNILLNIGSEQDLQNYLNQQKKGSHIDGDVDGFIAKNNLSEHGEQIKNWYYGNFDPKTGKHTMARDLEGGEYDIQLIKNIINQQSVKPRLLDGNSLYAGLLKLHNDGRAHDLFVLYSKYLLGEDVTELAGNYSEGSGGYFDNDLALYRHTRVGDDYIWAKSRYRIIGEFNQGEIVRSGELNTNSNYEESEWVTLGEVSNRNITQIIDLKEGKIIYDRDSGYVDEEIFHENTKITNDINIDGEGISDNLLGEGDYQGELSRIRDIEGHNTSIEKGGTISKRGTIEIERFGKHFGINEQCIALQEMKKLAPNNVPNITNIEKDGDGNITSYEIEKIEGTPLSQYDRTKLNIDDLRNLLDIFNKFKMNGIFHGDISMENILVSEEMIFDGSIKKNFRIIDPIGYININDTNNISILSNEQFNMLYKIAQTKRGIKSKQQETKRQKRKRYIEKINNNINKFVEDISKFVRNINYSQYDLKTEAAICKKNIYISENYDEIKEVLTAIESNFINDPNSIYDRLKESHDFLKRAINGYDSTKARILSEINNIQKGDIIMIKHGNDYRKYKVKDIEQGNIILECKINNKVENRILSEDDIDNIIGLKKNIKVSEMREETELSGDVVEYLWPNGLNSEMSQGIIGDCYILASIYNMKKQPGFKELIRSMIVPTKSGYKISFKESYNLFTGQSKGPYEIFLTHSEIYKRRNSPYSLRSEAIGDVILERAYMEFRNRLWCPDSGNIWDGKRKDNQKKFIDRCRNLTQEMKEIQKKNLDKKIFAGQSGNPEEVFINFFGHGVQIKFFKATSLGNVDGDLFYVSGQKGAGGDSAFFETNDINGNKIKINKNHAYILLDYNEENGTVTLANPHDTKFKRFTVTLSDYEKYFSGMYSVEWIDENETTLNRIVADMVSEHSFHFDKIKGVGKTELIFESLYNQFGKMLMDKKILENHIDNILVAKTSTEKINKYNNFINDFGEYSNDVKEFLEGAGIKEYLGMKLGNQNITPDYSVGGNINLDGNEALGPDPLSESKQGSDGETNIKIIEGLGIDIQAKDTSEIMELTENQIENIKKIKELGIKVEAGDIYLIKDLALTEDQVENIREIKELGIELEIWNIDKIKDLELTENEIENIKKIKKLGAELNALHIDEIKYLELTDGEIENIREIKELGIELEAGNIDKIKDLALTEDQVENIRKIKELGIKAKTGNIDKIKDLKLTENEIENINKIKELGIELEAWNIDKIKDLALTENQIENIRKLRELGTELNQGNIDQIKDLELTETGIGKIKEINKLGIKVTSYDIPNIVGLTEDQVENIKKVKGQLEVLGIEVKGGDIDQIKDLELAEAEIEKIKEIKNLGIKVTAYIIPNIVGLTSDQIVNIKKIRELGIKVRRRSIKEIKDLKLTEDQIENIKRIKGLEIELEAGNIDKIKDLKLTEDQIENIKKIKELGIKVEEGHIDEIKDLELTETVTEKIKEIQNLGIKVTVYDIPNIIGYTEGDIENIRTSVIVDKLGIEINKSNIDRLKDLGLTKKEIDNLSVMVDKLGIEINKSNIGKLKGVELTEKEIDNLNFMVDNLGIGLTKWNLVSLKDITGKQINNLKRIEDVLGIQVNELNTNILKNITDEQISILEKIKGELGIEINIRNIDNLKGITEEEIENLKRVNSTFGIEITAVNIVNIDGLKGITEEEIENLKRVNNEFKIKVTARNIVALKDITGNDITKIVKTAKKFGQELNEYNVMRLKDLTDGQITTIEKAKKKLGIDVKGYYVDVLKDLTDDQITTIKKAKRKLGIKSDDLFYINSYLGLRKENCNLCLLKDLTKEQIVNIKKLTERLGVEGKYYIYTLKDLTEDQVVNIEKVIKIFGIYGIDKLKGITEEEIENLKRVNSALGMKIYYSNINQLKGITEEEVENLKRVNSTFGIEINEYTIDKLKGITEEGIENLKRINRELGIEINKFTVDKLKDITWKEAENLHLMKNKLGIEVIESDIYRLKHINLTEDQIDNIKYVASELGIEINKFTVDKLKDIRKDQIDNIKYAASELGIGVNEYTVDQLKDITENQIDKIKYATSKLGIQISTYAIQLKAFDLNTFVMTNEEIDNIIRISNEFGIEIRDDNINQFKDLELTQGEVDNIRKIVNENGINISSPRALAVLKDIISVSKTDIQEYNTRKHEYLRKYGTLSDEEFNALFRDKSDNFKIAGEKDGKYQIGNIHQTRLGYCYAYSGFELLKKSDFFDVLVKTSMKQTDNGWEVKLPLGDPNGHIIKVNNSEINSEYSFIDMMIFKGLRRTVCTTSDSPTGFKILEIAFIKEYIINNDKYDSIPIAKQARIEWKYTGDISITGDLLHMVEGGLTTEFFEHIVSKDFISTTGIPDHIDMKELLLSSLPNIGNIKIAMSLSPNYIKRECSSINGEPIEISSTHAYSIERVYYNKDVKRDVVVFVNPHHSGIKYEIPLEECCRVFTFSVATINLNNIFK